MRRTAIAAIVAGLVLCLGAIAWGPLVEPRLVKLPDDVDRTDRFEGTFTTFVDAATGAPLDTPVELPLTVERSVRTVPGETDDDVSLLEEVRTTTYGGRELVQTSRYAVDRRTMRNVADDRAWSLEPGNVEDRSGTYYLSLPMGLDSTGEQLRVWKPEAGAAYPLVSAGTGEAAGIDVVQLRRQLPERFPVSANQQALLQAQGLPAELTPQQAVAQLQAAGIDVSAALGVLAQVLPEEQLAAIRAALSRPVPLQYFVYGEGLVSAEASTGAPVSLTGIVDGIAVQPDLSALAALAPALVDNADIPAVAQLAASLQQLVEQPPQPVYELRYDQTADSVAVAAADAADRADDVELATTTIPWGLGLVGGVLVALGLVLLVIGRRRRSATPPSPPPSGGEPSRPATRPLEPSAR